MTCDKELWKVLKYWMNLIGEKMVDSYLNVYSLEWFCNELLLADLDVNLE